MPSLRLSQQEMRQISLHAEADHPAECCGLLTTARGSSLSRVHPCENIQNRMHQEDPTRYPRNSRIAYFIDPQEQYRIISAAEREGGRISGFYHSHIDCDAYFSEEDKERAMVWDEPAYPDAVYLVISVFGDGVRGHKAFAWDGESRDFTEVDVEARLGVMRPWEGPYFNSV